MQNGLFLFHLKIEESDLLWFGVDNHFTENRIVTFPFSLEKFDYHTLVSIPEQVY